MTKQRERAEGQSEGREKKEGERKGRETRQNGEREGRREEKESYGGQDGGTGGKMILSWASIKLSPQSYTVSMAQVIANQ